MGQMLFKHTWLVILPTDSHTLSKIVTGGELPHARSAATMAGVGSKLYVFGGLSRECGWLNDLYAFDIGVYLCFLGTLEPREFVKIN